MATITRGSTLIERELDEERIEQIRQGLAGYQATSAEVIRPHFLALLAEALGKNGQAEQGLRVLEEALVAAHRTGERYYEAELYRLKGELLLMQPASRGVSQAATGGKVTVGVQSTAVPNAARCFNQAILIARQQNAKSLELRAVMSVARLYRNQDKPKEARSFLAEVYNR